MAPSPHPFSPRPFTLHLLRADGVRVPVEALLARHADLRLRAAWARYLARRFRAASPRPAG